MPSLATSASTTRAPCHRHEVLCDVHGTHDQHAKRRSAWDKQMRPKLDPGGHFFKC
jgi:hypothetical protein